MPKKREFWCDGDEPAAIEVTGVIWVVCGMFAGLWFGWGLAIAVVGATQTVIALVAEVISQTLKKNYEAGKNESNT